MKKLLFALLLFSTIANSAITFVGVTAIPVNTAALDDSAPIVFDSGHRPTMATGDLGVVACKWAKAQASATIDVLDAGGQTVTAETQRRNLSTNQYVREFWFRFNGTWSSSLSFDTSSHGNFAGWSCVLQAFRPTTSTNTWAIDVAESAAEYVAPTTPFDVTITGRTTIAVSTVTVATWFVQDDNVWALQTGGWTNPGGATEWTNTYSGADMGISSAYKIQTTAAATGSVTNRQTTLGGDPGWTTIITFKENSSTSTFTVVPSITARTSTTQTIGFTLGASGNVYAVGCAIGSTAPTSAQIKAGQCTGSVTALASGNKAVTGADSIVLTYGTPLLAYDVYAIGTYSAVDTSIISLSGSLMGAASGYAAPVAIATLCTDVTCPVKKYNDNQGVALVVGDIFSCQSATTPDAYALTWSTDGNFSYPGSTSRQSLICKYQDVSIGTMAAGSPVTFYVNDSVPACSLEPFFHFKRNLAITPTSLVANCTDADSDTLTATVVGTVNPGLAVDSAGLLTGTPTTESEAGDSFDLQVSDIAGESTIQTVKIGVANTLTVPNCSSLSASVCQGLIELNGWLNSSTSYAYSSTVAAGTVISTSPAAATEVEPFTSVAMTVSLGTINVSPAVNGYTFSVDPDAFANIYAAAWLWHSKPSPTCTEIVNHTGAIAYGTGQSVIGEQITVAINNVAYIRSDVSIVGVNALGQCSPVTSYPGMKKSPGTNRTYVTVDVP